MISGLRILLIGIVLALFVLNDSPVSAEPILSSIGFSPNPVEAGSPTQLSITANDLVDIQGVFFRQPDGTNGSPDVGPFTQVGDVFTADVTFPSNSQGGIWRIAEIRGVNAVNQEYSFLAADLFAGTVACPAFENIGVFACASDLVETDGRITVNSDAVIPPPPVLSSLSFSPDIVEAGASTQLSITVSNLVDIEGVFFRQPDGTNGSPDVDAFTQVGDIFTAAVTFPANSQGGVWRIAELRGINAVNQAYSFLAADLFPGDGGLPRLR